MEEETRIFVETDPFKLKPRSCFFVILKLVNQYVARLLQFEIRLARKFIGMIASTVIIEAKQHSKYFKIIQDPKIMMLNVFEIEYMLWVVDPVLEFRKQDSYVKLQEAFERVNVLEFEGEKFRKYLGKQQRIWNLKNSNVFNLKPLYDK